MPHAAPGATTGIDASVLVEIAANPKKYARISADLDIRKGVAETAEARAANRMEEAAFAEQSATSALEVLTTRQAEFDTERAAIDTIARSAEQAAAVVTEREATCEASEADVSRREGALAGERDKAIAAIKAVLG